MPNMATIPFGDWRPDVALLDNQFANVAENVYPGANAYLPVKSLAAITANSLGAGSNDSFTKVMLHFEGSAGSTTITDVNAGGTSHTWATAGNAAITTSTFKFGSGGLALDGTGDYITTADSVDFTLGSSNFTI